VTAASQPPSTSWRTNLSERACGQRGGTTGRPRGTLLRQPPRARLEFRRPRMVVRAEVSALSFNDNCASLRVAPGTVVGAPWSWADTGVELLPVRVERHDGARRLGGSARLAARAGLERHPPFGQLPARRRTTYAQRGRRGSCTLRDDSLRRAAASRGVRVTGVSRPCLCRCLRACACWARISARHSG